MSSSILSIITFVVLASQLSTQAREWLSADGKKIEADFVDLVGETIHIKKGAKVFKFPLSKLSKVDQEFAKDEISKREKNAEAARSGPLTIAGQEIKRGQVNRITLDLSSDNQAIAKDGGRGWGKKFSDSTANTWVKTMNVGSSVTQLDLLIAVPANFDPTSPAQPVFVQWATTNIKSNNNVAGSYWGACSQNNWILISVDAKPNTAEAWATSIFYANIKEVFEQLHQAWPASKQWPVAVGGFSGGSKISQWMGPLMAQLPDVRVVGLWIGGCNDATLFHYGFEDLRVKKSSVKKLKIFISSGKSDNLVNAQHRQNVENGCKATGSKQIRSELFDGGHSVHPQHLTDAFKWFLEDK